jgi:subtilase family serine protease
MNRFSKTASLAGLVLFVLLLAAFTFAPASASAQCTTAAVSRVTTFVDDTARVSLAGNVHPMARAEFDQGRVDDGLPLEHIIMLLQRSPEQESALEAHIDEMHNQNSPLFHQWLSTSDMARCYGVADADIAAVSSWLESHGFTIDSVPSSKMMLIFTGTAGQVSEAFRTEIHNVNVHGKNHIANMSAPQIPAAFASVIAGFRSLHDFLPKPTMRMVGVAKRDAATGKLYMAKGDGNSLSLSKFMSKKNSNPLVTYGNNPFCAPSDCEWLGPDDFYTIYNETPLLSGHLCRGAACDGAGQTIAVIEETDVCAGQSGTSPDDCAGANDLTSFRSQFGLPPAKVHYFFGVPRFCSDPGVQGPNGTGEESEADIDVQWTSTTAPGATVDYIACASTMTSGGVDLAAMYAVNHLASKVSSFSVSYGVCEAQLPVNDFPFIFGSNAFYNELWKEAAAQGQTVNISAGDSGDDTCDRGEQAATSGVNVNGLASTPWNVALGGTDFTDNYSSNFALTPTQYWNSNDTPPFGSALSYIPETTWNQACGSTLLVSFLDFLTSTPYTPEQVCNGDSPFGLGFTTVNGAGGGGISSVYRIPTWQSVYGVGASFTSRTMRNLPDVSLFASANIWGHALQFCESDILTGTGGGTPCDYTNVNEGGVMAAGGTSFVAPQFNGVIALINQATSSRQGQANYRLYAMADSEYGVPGLPNFLTFLPSAVTCESNLISISEFSRVFPACVFYDIHRTPAIATNTCGGLNNGNCVVDGNEMPCVTGSPNCFTATSGDAFGLLSNSTSTFEPAWYQSFGFSDAVGLGSFNITNLVRSWVEGFSLNSYASTTLLSVSSGTISAADAKNTATLTATVTATGRGSIAPPMGLVSFYASDSSTALSCADTSKPQLHLLGSSPLIAGVGNATAVLSGVTAEQLGGSGAHQVIACFRGDAASDAPSAGSAGITVSK